MYLFSAPNPGHVGHTKSFRSDDPALRERWIRAEDRPGFAVYHCPNPLKPGATTHGRDSTDAIDVIFVDVDPKDIVETPEEILKVLTGMQHLLAPSFINESGHGYHFGYVLKEPIKHDDPDYARVCEMQEVLINYLAADPSVRPWSLLRLLGTHNSKIDPPVQCREIVRGAPVDLTEVTDLCDIVRDTAALTRKAKERPAGNGSATDDTDERGPVDHDAEWAALEAGKSANLVQCRIIPSLLRRAIHPEDVLNDVVDKTMVIADRCQLGWTRGVEVREVRKRVISAYKLFLRDYDYTTGVIPEWLPGDFHKDWAEKLLAGRRPSISFGRGGFCVWSTNGAAFEQAKEPGTEQGEQPAGDPPRDGAPQPKCRFKLVAFSDLHLGNDPLYLVDELIPIRGLVDLWGKAKCCKSFWAYDLCFHIAMGWEYRDRYVQQGAVVYCAFEGAHGYKKRKEALRLHYGIEEGTHVPLFLMPGQANLITEHALLIASIRMQLSDIKPAVVVLDTLNKSLFGSENKDVDMGAYVRAAEAVRDAFDCVVIIVHHCGYDDTRPRGHSSLPAAVDAQLAVTRSENVITVTVEMMRDGPEEIQVVSEVVPVEVGVDRNGKVLTSLVVVPSDAEAITAERRSWPPQLAVFYAALKDALASSGVTHQPEAGALPVRAVDQKIVRKRFYATYADGEEDKKKRQDRLKHAFQRALSQAQQRDIIRTQHSETGQDLMWLAGQAGMA